MSCSTSTCLPRFQLVELDEGVENPNAKSEEDKDAKTEDKKDDAKAEDKKDNAKAEDKDA